jgi:perosamine synthetase
MENFDPQLILSALKKVLPEGHERISLHEPRFKGNELKYVTECIETGWVSSVGKFVDRIEKDLTDITGSKYAIAVVNGTAALHISLILAGVEANDEVLMPTLTFVATANAISYCRAIPHFIDIEEKTLGVDAAKLESYLNEIAAIKNGFCFNKRTGRRIKAVVPMHTFGHSVDLDSLSAVCDKFCLALIEDAAESLGTYYKGHHTGTRGLVSAISFNGNKIVTTGGGGAVLTNDEKLAKLAKHITTTAKVPHQWTYAHDLIGFNYRMPNINAALGCAQLESLNDFVSQKRILAEKYKEAFKNINGVHFFTEPSFSKSNYWLNAIILDESLSNQRDQILTITNQSGIMTRPAWTLMHELTIYKDCPKMENLAVSKKIETCLINIPSSPFLAGK